MDQPTHVIDPEGEVILILRNANLPFADWFYGAFSKLKLDVQDKSQETLKEKSFCIQASAKHLVLASPVFKQILTGGWKESVTYLQKGSVEITTEGWDIEALLILLRIMHCQTHHVPRKLTLEMFAKVTVLADYYGCKETIGFFADTWIESLKEVPPATYCRDLILWLWISYYMRLPDEFQKVSSIAISQGNGLIDNLGLPIPHKVLEKIDSNRQQAINNIIILLQEKREALLSGSQSCSFECSSIMYGALTKQMQSNGLLSPVPVAPFLNLNYEGLVWKLRSFKSPEWYSPGSDYPYRKPTLHSCPQSTFKSLFGTLNNTVGGLNLDDF